MSGWRTVRLADILTAVRTPVVIEDDREYMQITVRIKGRGLTLRRRAKGSEIATKRQFMARSGQLLVSKIDARNGGLALVPDELDGGVVSGDFPVFDVDETLCVPAYLGLYVARQDFWDECLAVSEGSTNRVRLVPDQFLDLEVDLPSPHEQQAILRSVNAMALAHAAWTREADALWTLLEGTREGLVESLDLVEARDLVHRIEGGKSPKALDRPPTAGERGVLKVSSIRPGSFRPWEAKALDDSVSMPDRAMVSRGEVLLNRASGSVHLLCSACRVDVSPQNLYLSDKTLRAVPRGGVHPDCLVEMFAARSVRLQVADEADGSSGAKNVSQGDILDLELPWPGSLGEQSTVVGRLLTVRRGARAAAAEATRLDRLRTALVEELVSGARPAPRLAKAAYSSR